MAEPRVSVAVQHHPARAGLIAERLLPLLDGLDVDVVTDPGADGRIAPWRTYRHALETTPGWATHRLVIQDDAVPCDSFARVLHSAVTARPDRLLELCVCGEPRESIGSIWAASEAGHPWAVMQIGRWLPAIAAVWPVDMIAASLEWVSQQGWPADFMADDEIIGRIASWRQEPVLASVPSIVRHDDMDESTLGNKAHYGRNLDRVTFCPWRDDCDLTQVDWTVGPR